MITVSPRKGVTVQAGTLYQWDYGQRLKIVGIQLPTEYEVNYALSDNGNVITETGEGDEVSIPDELLEKGRNIRGWIYLQDGETGKTVYDFTIKVKKRAKPTTPREPIIPAEGVEF